MHPRMPADVKIVLIGSNRLIASGSKSFDQVQHLTLEVQMRARDGVHPQTTDTIRKCTGRGKE